MGRTAKLAIGLAAVLLLGWISEGPVGKGEAFIQSLEAGARAVIASNNHPDIVTRAARSPLRRIIILSGPADDFQRNGMGSFKGLTGQVLDVRGVAQVRWADEPPPPGLVLPLLAEIFLLMIGAYILGLGLALWIAYRNREGRYA